ncbi:thiamine transporter Thi9 [Schizosaccharomyces cryophilus OY26]|uniref:Thiamine transporter Thi9 n=1 Tax=Schizosaccharomyces cryophilus (strain OY26 / ATCC MYA-4695 / CBS 11777 / NBRC 106824 / NRRL Y48691) TaxID=653667 RepID=S9VXN6_SCHCR|nr:thiamine transporter Thi9 [Schizosaccharomyces cryophilus OY26]EPY50974.1 thiamine transporter Thi9 [Schizosaccharomyces cryophilus OY26]
MASVLTDERSTDGDLFAQQRSNTSGSTTSSTGNEKVKVFHEMAHGKNEQSDGVSSDADSDDALIRSMGYKPVLHRTFKFFESFAASFAAMDVVSGVRLTFSYGVTFGGPAAYWVSMLVTGVCSTITAASLAEFCSALPTSGSVYLWAAEAGGPQLGRFFSFLVAWWSTTAWTTFVASTAQSCVNFIFGEVSTFGNSWSTDDSNVKFRAVQWIVAEVVLIPPRYYRWVFKLSMILIFVDYILNLIWLPIATSRKSHGFQSAKWVFTETIYDQAGYSKEVYDSSGNVDTNLSKLVPRGWQWCLAYFASAGVIVGYDASGHIAEETKDASNKAARGIFFSAFTSSIVAFSLTILFLFCCPPLDTFNDIMYNTASPQPFVNFYSYVLGRGGHVIMNVIIILELFLNAVIGVLACSRLVFGVSRDGVLPFSGWISQVSKEGQPKNAITVIYIVSALLLCTILPSSVAFSSLVSAAGAPSFACYALLAFGRLFITRDKFPKGKWSLGIFSKPFMVVSLVYNSFVFIINISPYSYPVTGSNFNYAIVITGAVSIFAVICTLVIPRSRWIANRYRYDQSISSNAKYEK